jgi:hypothetical protein
MNPYPRRRWYSRNIQDRWMWTRCNDCRQSFLCERACRKKTKKSIQWRHWKNDWGKHAWGSNEISLNIGTVPGTKVPGVSGSRCSLLTAHCSLVTAENWKWKMINENMKLYIPLRVVDRSVLLRS